MKKLGLVLVFAVAGIGAACTPPGEAACTTAGDTLTGLPCQPDPVGEGEGEVEDACVGMPDDCATFWNGVASTAECTDFGGTDFPAWDFEAFPPDTEAGGVVCATGEAAAGEGEGEGEGE